MLRVSLYPREEAQSKRNTSACGTVIWGPGAGLPRASHVQSVYLSPALLATRTPAVHRTVGVVENILLLRDSSKAVSVVF
jgi:hypothetical protein